MIATKNSMPSMRCKYILLPLIVLLLQACAAPRQVWYKNGGTQREFDLDAKECEVIAGQQALLKSENSKRYDPLTYAELYQRCIRDKGWSIEPPRLELQPAQAALPATELGVRHDNLLSAFGINIMLPANVRLLSEKKQTMGPTHLHSLMFLTDGKYVNIILQESGEATFYPVEYPVSEPFHLYTSDWSQKMCWAAFWAATQGEWVKGIGAFINVSKKERIIVVITSAMAPPAEKPPENLQLAHNQFLEMELFVQQWQPWLENQAPKESVVWRGLKSTFDVLKTF